MIFIILTMSHIILILLTMMMSITIRKEGECGADIWMQVSVMQISRCKWVNVVQMQEWDNKVNLQQPAPCQGGAADN